MDARTDTLVGPEATVAGRAAYVIALSPKPGGCPDTSAPATGKPDAAAGAAESKGNGAKGAEPGDRNRVGDQDVQVRIWVDKVTFLALRTEVLGPDGTVMKQFEVTDVQYNLDIDPAIFTYTPPPGAVVNTYTGAPGEDLKSLLLGRPAGADAQLKKP